MRYKFFEHTADAKFRAYGETLEEAFCNAALATASLMWNWQKIKKSINYGINVEGNDLEQLLCSFLEEILYLLDTKEFLLSAVKNLKIERKEGKYSLKAVFWGDKNKKTYELFGNVKAITYNEMEINRDLPFSVQVVVDM